MLAMNAATLLQDDTPRGLALGTIAFLSCFGTVVGVVAGLGAAELTHGHPRVGFAVIFVCLFFGVYRLRVSHASFVFAITLILALLYQLLLALLQTGYSTPQLQY